MRRKQRINVQRFLSRHRMLNYDGVFDWRIVLDHLLQSLSATRLCERFLKSIAEVVDRC